ncbi:hypothetical protein AHF37_12526 [Paragonimus kellicotti]|nr:hypothetical protein AHF37_12526 [Paragonimus kellicotti]
MHKVPKLNVLLPTKPRVTNNTSNSDHIKQSGNANIPTKSEALNEILNPYSASYSTSVGRVFARNGVLHDNEANKHAAVDAVNEDNLQSTNNVQIQQVGSAELEISQGCLTNSIPEASLSSTLDSDVKALVDTDVEDSIQSIADSELKSIGSSCEFEDSLVEEAGNNSCVNGEKQCTGFIQHLSENETSLDFEGLVERIKVRKSAVYDLSSCQCRRFPNHRAMSQVVMSVIINSLI